MRASGASCLICDIIPLGKEIIVGLKFSFFISRKFSPDLSPGVWMKKWNNKKSEFFDM